MAMKHEELIIVSRTSNPLRARMSDTIGDDGHFTTISSLLLERKE
jgi:hypothetical protein